MKTFPLFLISLIVGERLILDSIVQTYKVSNVYFLTQSFAYSSGKAKAWLEKGLRCHVQSPQSHDLCKTSLLAKQIALRQLLSHASNLFAVPKPLLHRIFEIHNIYSFMPSLNSIFPCSCHNRVHSGGYERHKNQIRHRHTFFKELHMYTYNSPGQKKKKRKDPEICNL